MRNHTSATLFGWGERPEPMLELGTIVTDRPDFTEASSTVGAGVVQLETGYTFTKNEETTSHSWGEPLFRVGLFANWLEFRTALFPVTQNIKQAGGRQSDSGTEDLYLGFKIGLTPQHGWLPETALMPQMTVPTGSATFTESVVLPGVNYLYGWDLTEKTSFGGSTQFNESIDGTGNQYTQWAQSLTVGRSLNEELSMYSEWFALLPDGAADIKPEHYFNGGFTYLFSDDIQFDIRAGVGLNEASADFFAGSGVSLRFH
jgi:hypothetical protein